jgi:hypothetical protein
LGELPHVGRLFTLGICNNSQKKATILFFAMEKVMYVCILTDTRFGLHFGRFFAQTHLVTLDFWYRVCTIPESCQNVRFLCKQCKESKRDQDGIKGKQATSAGGYVVEGKCKSCNRGIMTSVFAKAERLLEGVGVKDYSVLECVPGIEILQQR